MYNDIDSVKKIISELLQSVEPGAQQLQAFTNIYRLIAESKSDLRPVLLEYAAHESIARNVPFYFDPVEVSPREKKLIDLIQEFMTSENTSDEENGPVAVTDANEPDEAMELFLTCRNKYKHFTNGLVTVLVGEGLPTVQYYERVWNAISNTLADAPLEAKGYCLYEFLMDARTPYAEIPAGLSMSEDEYQTVSNSISADIQMINFILALPNVQKTQTASQLLHILDHLDTDAKIDRSIMRTVLMSHIIALLQQSN